MRKGMGKGDKIWGIDVFLEELWRTGRKGTEKGNKACRV